MHKHLLNHSYVDSVAVFHGQMNRENQNIAASTIRKRHKLLFLLAEYIILTGT